MVQVEIYTQDWCGYCARAKHLFDQKGIAYQEIDAPRGSAARGEAQVRSGGRTTVPQIFIGGKHIGGCDELVALEQQGKLDTLLTASETDRT